MDSEERVALVNRMVGLVNQLYLLETCCPQLSCGYKNSAQNNAQAKKCTPVLECVPCYPVQNRAPKAHQNIPRPGTKRSSYGARASPTRTQEEPKPCFLLKCKPHKCQTDPDQQPLITWTPVLEIRKTSNAKDLERQNDDPTTKYVFLEPPGCPYKPVWSTKDPMCEKYCGPPEGCPALGPPPGYNGAPIELCCPGGKGPPVDRWGQPYECKQTLDGRPVCNPTREAGPSDWCDPMTSPFRRCDAEKDQTPKILARGKVLNQRFNNVCSDQANRRRSSSLYKRPVYPGRDTCGDGSCRCPNNPNRRNSRQSQAPKTRGSRFSC